MTTPTLLVSLDPSTSKLAIKIPKPRAKWHGQFKDLNEACKAADKDLTPPYNVKFVLWDKRND